MKTRSRLLLLLPAALLLAGCELESSSDNSHVVVSNGNVTSFATQQGNVVVTGGTDNRSILDVTGNTP